MKRTNKVVAQYCNLSWCILHLSFISRLVNVSVCEAEAGHWANRSRVISQRDLPWSVWSTINSTGRDLLVLPSCCATAIGYTLLCLHCFVIRVDLVKKKQKKKSCKRRKESGISFLGLLCQAVVLYHRIQNLRVVFSVAGKCFAIGSQVISCEKIATVGTAAVLKKNKKSRACCLVR